MFGIFKKKEKVEKVEVEEIIDREGIEKEIRELKSTVNDKLDDVSKSEILQKIGILYSKLSDNDNSIKYLEESLDLHKNLGNGYKTLLSVYNKKRAEAARYGIDDDIQYWLKKIDGLMQLSKDITRGTIK